MTSIVTAQIAKHIRELFNGGSWTGSNMRSVLTGITWEQAISRPHSFNSIAVLVFHTNYYLGALIRVLEGGKLEAHDKYSFDLPPIGSQKDWEELVNKTFREAELIAGLIENLPDEKLWDIVEQQKYGIFYRNLHGLIEHTYYHLGQMALIKKLVTENSIVSETVKKRS